MASAAQSAPALKSKRGRPKGSKSKKSTDMLEEAPSPPPPPPPAASQLTARGTHAESDPPDTEVTNRPFSARPRRRISIARAATAANRKAAATEKEAVAKARAEAAAAVAAAVAAAAAATAEAEAGSPAGAVSNSVIFTGRAFSDKASKRAIDDGDLVAATVAAMKKGRGGGRKRGRPPVAKSRSTRRLSQERAGSRDDPLLDSQQQGEENSSSSDSLLGRAEIDAILSLGGNGVGGGVGVEGSGGRESGSDWMGAPVVARERQEEGERGGSDEGEEAAALRALMSDVGFREDEVAAYSLEELVLLREVCVICTASV